MGSPHTDTSWKSPAPETFEEGSRPEIGKKYAKAISVALGFLALTLDAHALPH